MIKNVGKPGQLATNHRFPTSLHIVPTYELCGSFLCRTNRNESVVFENGNRINLHKFRVENIYKHTRLHTILCIVAKNHFWIQLEWNQVKHTIFYQGNTINAVHNKSFFLSYLRSSHSTTKNRILELDSLVFAVHSVLLCSKKFVAKRIKSASSSSSSSSRFSSLFFSFALANEVSENKHNHKSK